MKKLFVLAIAAASLWTLACVTPVDDVDANTSRRDAGGGTDTASGTDTTVVQTWNPNSYGAECTSDSQCPGGKCFTLFETSTTRKCFKTCATTNDCADFLYDVANVQCLDSTSAGKLCIHASPQNGPCGDVANSICLADDQGCAMDNTGFGLCVRGCKTDDPQSTTSCTSIPAAMCGCEAGQGCSMAIQLSSQANDPNPDGICAATTDVGDSCGQNSTTLVLTPCTGDQTCEGVTQSNPTGTCQEATTDAGVAEDA